MWTESRTLFTLAELAPNARQKAVDNHRYWNTEDIEWWDGVYRDAESIGLKITSFDLDRRSECGGHFTESGEDVARAILAEHGPDCETVATAKAFLKDRAEVLSKWTEDGEDDLSHEGEDELEDCEKEFLHSLLEDYRIMLERECEYLESDESVAESLECNEMEFLEDGTNP